MGAVTERLVLRRAAPAQCHTVAHFIVKTIRADHWNACLLYTSLLVLLGRHAAEAVVAVDQPQQARGRLGVIATQLKHMREIQALLIACLLYTSRCV